jgi:hypothetical protein
MNTILNETRVTYKYTNKNGATVIIKNVPAKFLKDEYGHEHQTYAFGVAMRLEELSNRAFEVDSSDGAIHELEF